LRVPQDPALSPAGRSGRRRVEFSAGPNLDPFSSLAPLLRFEIRCLDGLHLLALDGLNLLALDGLRPPISAP
jgi:hypothetical protein